MDPSYERTVVVGVDGSPEALLAARYALGQAARRGLDVLLVYGYSLPMIDAPMTGDFFDSLLAAGRSVLDDAIAALEIPPGVTVSTQVAESVPAMLMQRLSQSARLMVVGQHATAWYDRLGQGSVASPLAHHSGCPVVVVPPAWRQRRQEERPVVVALDGGKGVAVAALKFAFEEAELLGSTVVALHAVADRTTTMEADTAERNVADLLAGVARDHPGTRSRLSPVHGDPQRVILTAAQSAAVLVCGPPHTEGLAVWSRSMARRVMTSVECPMVIVPSRPHATTPVRPDALVAS